MNGEIKKQFPLTKDIVYLDNAATSLTPQPVITEMNGYYQNYCANIDRGVHHLSKIASHKYRDAHKKTGELINCRPENIVFTKNTTEAINMVAGGLTLKEGDHVITSIMEHHSNLIPWLRLQKKGIELDIIGMKDGVIDIEELKNKININTKLVSICHASNVLGTINPVRQVGEICSDHNTQYLVDGAQSTPHLPINIEEIGCDYLAFSGHKMLGPTGIGVLACKPNQLQKLSPTAIGGGNVENVTKNTYTLKTDYHGYEGGTPNIAGAIGLAKAIEILQEIGPRKIQKHEEKQNKTLTTKLRQIKDLEILYPDKNRTGVISFKIKNKDPHRIAVHLDQNNIIVRSGNHCSQPLIEKHGYKKVVRASHYIYNTKNDIKKLTSQLQKITQTK